VYTIPENKKIILFDGVCNLCNKTVNKVIDYDKKNTFLFTALQSETGQQIIKKIGINTNEVDSIILYENNMAYYIKSTAAIKIMNDLGGFWSVTKIFWIFPEGFRNWVYDIIARNRYKWFGKEDNCRIPTPELKAKFLD
jgi:predicted DCC family thiol-disulfide oxidoreductase YuxK